MGPDQNVTPARNRTANSQGRFSTALPSPLPRRKFLQLVLGAAPATCVLAIANQLSAAETPPTTPGKPNSKVAGVQIGLNVPYSFANPQMSGDEVLKSCLQLGLSAVELRTQPVEAFLGAPTNLVYAKTPRTAAEQMREWRRACSTERAGAFRKKYEEAGVLIEIVKVDGLFAMSDEELDYVFALAKALGGRAISSEISQKEEELKRVGKFADKHQFMVGYHGHAKTGPEHWERAFELARFNGANVDIGHFVAGNNFSPVPFIEKHHQRITHVHIKDRKLHEGPNTPFGEGDTPHPGS
jgi:sugar phosphate isomerase/epimerase